jgi:predicted  nucleic acid-binding Zn-ribbon protein
MTWADQAGNPTQVVKFSPRPFFEKEFNPIFGRLAAKNLCGAVGSRTRAKRPPFTTTRGAEDYRFRVKEEKFNMVCSMVKKALVGTALGAGTLFLVFGTSAPSYVKTAFHKVRENVKESIDPQFDIDRARQDIENLTPMFDQNKETLARAEADAETLEGEVIAMQASLDQGKQTILAMQHKLKTGEFRLTGHIADTADNLKAELANRLDTYGYKSDTLKQKQEVLKAKRRIIEAAHEQLENLRSQKSLLLGKLANIEAKLRVLEAAQTKNEFNFDGSTLSHAKKTIADLEKRLNVMSHRAAIDGRYGDLDSGPTTYVDPRRDVIKEVEDKFGDSARPAEKSGDKSL